MAQKTSAFVFASGSSVHVASSASTQAYTTPKAGAPAESARVHGTATVSVNGVSLEATFHLEPGGMSVVVRGFDGADPDGTRMHDRLLLKPGERRVIPVRRAYRKPPAYFTITRLGDEVQISADDS
jgi:hypothetical protein